jgi:trimeric autotransporter adhesin
VVNSNISTFYYRVGGQNLTTAAVRRLRSVYFKKFWFNNALLSANGLVGFSGALKGTEINLNWTLAANAGIKSVDVERSSNGKNFSSIAVLTVMNSDVPENQHYTDYNSSSTNYYRLKLTYADGRVQYSNVIVFNNKLATGHGFKVYPNIIQSDANISLTADKKQQAILKLYDFSGRMIKQQSLQVEQGNNSLHLDDLSSLVRGNYIMVLNMGSERYSQQIVKR